MNEMENTDLRITKFMELLGELNEAIAYAGGKPLSIEALLSMSAIELLSLISPNNIHFSFTASSG